MQLDRKMLDRLLNLNDDQLSELIKGIAREAGIEPAQLGLNPDSIHSIRSALGSATEQDLAHLHNVYQSYKQNRRH